MILRYLQCEPIRPSMAQCNQQLVSINCEITPSISYLRCIHRLSFSEQGAQTDRKKRICANCWQIIHPLIDVVEYGQRCDSETAVGGPNRDYREQHHQPSSLAEAISSSCLFADAATVVDRLEHSPSPSVRLAAPRPLLCFIIVEEESLLLLILTEFRHRGYEK